MDVSKVRIQGERDCGLEEEKQSSSRPRVKWKTRNVGCLEDQEQPTLALQQLSLDPQLSGWIVSLMWLFDRRVLVLEGVKATHWEIAKET